MGTFFIDYSIISRLNHSYNKFSSVKSFIIAKMISLFSKEDTKKCFVPKFINFRALINYHKK